jgi:hypothetical protein
LKCWTPRLDTWVLFLIYLFPGLNSEPHTC